MALTQQQAAEEGSAIAAMPCLSTASQASLRPAAARAIPQEPNNSLARTGETSEGEVPVIDSLEQEIERLQRFEQRSAQLQTTLGGFMPCSDYPNKSLSACRIMSSSF